MFKLNVLLTTIIDASNHIKCVSLSHQKCGSQPTLINLHPNEYNVLVYLIRYMFQIKQQI